MGKSLGNAVYLSDSEEVLNEKIRNAVTDTNRIAVKIPGNPDVCTVYTYHKAFNPEEAGNVCSMCRNAEMGCVACKKMLMKKMNEILAPIRERRHYYEEHMDEVRDIIHSGTDKANAIGNANIKEIKEKMHIVLS